MKLNEFIETDLYSDAVVPIVTRGELYLYITPEKPTTLLSNGLRPDNDGIILWNVGEICDMPRSIDVKDAGRLLAQGISKIFDVLGSRRYGTYVYTVILPEYAERKRVRDIPPYNVVYDQIPPSYIKFVAPVSKIDALIEYSEYTRLAETVFDTDR